MRLAPGDEVCSSLLALCKQEKLGAGTVSGIGAAGRATLGVYRVAEQVYVSRSLEGRIRDRVACGGIYPGRRASPICTCTPPLSDADGGVYAGHLSEAYISATAEIFITRCRASWAGNATNSSASTFWSGSRAAPAGRAGTSAAGRARSYKKKRAFCR